MLAMIAMREDWVCMQLAKRDRTLLAPQFVPARDASDCILEHDPRSDPDARSLRISRRGFSSAIRSACQQCWPTTSTKDADGCQQDTQRAPAAAAGTALSCRPCQVSGATAFAHNVVGELPGPQPCAPASWTHRSPPSLLHCQLRLVRRLGGKLAQKFGVQLVVRLVRQHVPIRHAAAAVLGQQR